MTPDRQRRISQLYHDVRTRHAREREAYLATACAGDLELRREVESLLACDTEAAPFLESPALDVAADLLEVPAVSTASSLIGRQIGTFQIVALIGAGGMGTVYRAHDTRLGRDVALKILPSDFTADPARRARFEREAHVLATLNHPHIAAIYGVADAEDLSALVLELVEGGTLADRLATGPLPVPQALTLARQVADALAAAHDKGIVHRDLKPANVGLTAKGDVKVLDFGLAKAVERDAHGVRASNVTAGRTRSGMVLGTPAYMSPEQARGLATDPQSDIWAFGCLLYEMLTGHAAFERATVTDTLAAIVTGEPDWSCLPASLPVPVRHLVQRCLDKDPLRRLRDIGDAAIVIDGATQPSAGALRPSQDGGGFRQPARYATVGGVIVALVVLGWVTTQNVPGLLNRVVGTARPPSASPITASSSVTGGTPATRSLAVLPLRNLTGDAGQDWFAEAMTDELMTALSHIKGLLLISGISARHYKGTDKTAPEIARELGDIDWLVEGAVSRNGDRVLISVSLDDVKANRRTWSDGVEQPRDISRQMVHGIAHRVALATGVTLSPAEETRLAGQRPLEPDAYESYVHGLYFRDRQLDGGCDLAKPYLLKAIAIDPTLAGPHAALAYCYGANKLSPRLPASDAAAKGRAEALKAIQLDPDLADAYVSLALIEHRTEYNWAAAERNFKHALHLNPGHVEALVRYGEWLYLSGRVAEGLTMIREGVRRVPFSGDYRVILGYALYNLRRGDEAIEQFVQARDLDRSRPVPLWGLTQVYALQGRHDVAVAEYLSYLRSLLVPVRATTTTDTLAAVYRQHGWEAFWREELKLAETGIREPDAVWQSFRDRDTPNWYMARRHARLGDHDRAIARLELAYSAREGRMVFLDIEPIFESLRSDPRFQDFIRRIGPRPG